jgi:SAM-dependent methyltransferase
MQRSQTLRYALFSPFSVHPLASSAGLLWLTVSNLAWLFWVRGTVHLQVPASKFQGYNSFFMDIQHRLLLQFFPVVSDRCTGEYFHGKSKLRESLGAFDVTGKTVIDFGCGEGREVLELARAGANRVIGIDTWEQMLATARRNASDAELCDICSFAPTTDEKADVITSIDAFEHFGNPREILDVMYGMLRPGGECLISFGPPWYHPLGGHLFSVFPWAHLLFSERALIRWRNQVWPYPDGAKRFSEIAGGLNQMTIREFERLVAASSFHLEYIELVPIRKLKCVHNRLTREFTTAVVRCRLRKPLYAPTPE